jgi:hypothetical protein
MLLDMTTAKHAIIFSAYDEGSWLYDPSPHTQFGQGYAAAIFHERPSAKNLSKESNKSCDETKFYELSQNGCEKNGICWSKGAF